MNINAWDNNNANDLGIGNYSGSTPDWTFAFNASLHEIKNLEVWVRTVPEPSVIALFAIGVLGLGMKERAISNKVAFLFPEWQQWVADFHGVELLTSAEWTRTSNRRPSKALDERAIHTLRVQHIINNLSNGGIKQKITCY